MSESFDPYYTWLGIPPAQQPPSHYRLLGIEPLESNPEVIESAADQRMAHLRTFQTGKRGTLTQRLLNEVAAAKVCLLDPNKKAAYDAALRQQQAAEETDAVAADVFASAAESATGSSSASSSNAARSKPNIAVVGGSVAAVVLLVLIAAWVFLSGGKTSDEPQSVAKTNTAPKQAAAESASPKPDTPAVGQAASLPASENAAKPTDAPTPSKPAEQPLAATPGTEQPPASPQPAANENETMESLLKAGRLSENLAKLEAWTRGGNMRFDPQANAFLCDNGNDSTVVSSAGQVVLLNQSAPGLICAVGDSKAENVAEGPRLDYSLYLDITYADGTNDYGHNAPFDPGTHDWQHRELVFRAAKPVKQVAVSLLLRKRSGKAWFRGLELRVLKSADAPPSTATAKASPGQASPAATEEVKKHPIPSAEIQRDIGTAIEETYKTSQAKTPEAKVQLAKELSAAAGKSAKPEEQYVLLRKAIDLACDGGDAALMLETIGPMTDAFAIDPLAAKAAMLERFAKGPRSPARVQSLAEGSRAVIEEAIAEDRYEIASNLAKTISDASSRASPQLRKEAADRRKRVGQAQKHFEEVQKALETLKATPDDAEANLTAGSWYCFVKDDWKTGLAHLVKGSDPVLKSLAGREVSSPPATPEDQLKLADAWWDAGAERRGEQQAAMLRTAGHWYEQAIGQLQGINKTKAEKRLSQIAELTQDTPSRPGREPSRAIAPFDAKRARAYQLQWARYLKVPVEFTNSIGMKFVLIPPGEFVMGSSKQLIDDELRAFAAHGWYKERLPAQSPQHRVRITKPFWLGVTEVTQQEYSRVMNVNPSKWQDDPKKPVEQVSWNDADEFCRRLSELPEERRSGYGYQLPSEAQWEHACRAGNAGGWCFSPESDSIPGGAEETLLGEYAWFSANSGSQTHPVAQKRPNAWGLYDMHGNVFEWCHDWYGRDYYASSPPVDPMGPSVGSQRVIRGCCWEGSARICRSAARGSDASDARRDSRGFRVVRTLQSQTTSPKETKRPTKATSRMRPLNPAAVRTFKTLEGHEAPVLGLAFSPDGRLLASASADRTIRLWDTGAWEPVRTLSGHDGPVNKLAFTPDGRTLLSASDDKTARVWNVPSGELVRKW